MNPASPHSSPLAGLFLLGGALFLQAQSEPRFLNVAYPATRETFLLLSVPAGEAYRIDVAAPGGPWQPWQTRRSAGANAHADTAAPYLDSRFYRAVQLADPNALTGDHLPTDDGDLLIHPVNHASFVMRWNDLMIYNDPVGGATPYQAFARANLILVSHSHGDHYNATTLDAVRGTNAVIIAPQAVYNAMSTTLRALTLVLPNGAATNAHGITIEAIPAYNSYHTPGSGNGYVITVGGRRLYMSGDTEDVAEMRALPDIDVAFLCINLPFTMDIIHAADAVRAFRPAVVYPYHFRNQNGTYSDLAQFKQMVGTDVGVEVRIREWY